MHNRIHAIAHMRTHAHIRTCANTASCICAYAQRNAQGHPLRRRLPACTYARARRWVNVRREVCADTVADMQTCRHARIHTHCHTHMHRYIPSCRQAGRQAYIHTYVHTSMLQRRTPTPMAYIHMLTRGVRMGASLRHAATYGHTEWDHALMRSCRHALMRSCAHVGMRVCDFRIIRARVSYAALAPASGRMCITGICAPEGMHRADAPSNERMHYCMYACIHSSMYRCKHAHMHN